MIVFAVFAIITLFNNFEVCSVSVVAFHFLGSKQRNLNIESSA